jgi:hypothetical protein
LHCDNCWLNIEFSEIDAMKRAALCWTTGLFLFGCVLATSSTVLAHTQIFTASLNSAAEENPANTSPGTGAATLTLDLDLKTLHIAASFADLEGTTTAAHVHCCTTNPGTGGAGVATPTPTFPGFPSGVTSGSYDMTFDMTQASSYNGSFITANTDIDGAFAKLSQGLLDGTAYLNIHSSRFGGGEIRGFFALVPEPTSLVVTLVGVLGLTAARRRRG